MKELLRPRSSKLWETPILNSNSPFHTFFTFKFCVVFIVHRERLPREMNVNCQKSVTKKKIVSSGIHMNLVYRPTVEKSAQKTKVRPKTM